MRAPRVRCPCICYTDGTGIRKASVGDQLPCTACSNSDNCCCRSRAAMSAYHRLRISVLLSKSVTNRFSLQIVLRGLANPPGSVDVIPTAGCAQCARCSLLTFVRAWALGAHFLRSYVRDRVRARLRSLAGVPLLGLPLIPNSSFVQLFVQSRSFCPNLFVLRNFDKFSTILASIVCYDYAIVAP